MSSPSAAEAKVEARYFFVPRSTLLSLAIFSSAVAIVWAFPWFWYANRPTTGDFLWFAEQTQIPGWNFERVPVGKSAEAILVADRIVNGEFSQPHGPGILVYSAKRYLEKENEIGLFSHTPDRCWTAAGWKIEPAEPDFVKVTVHGLDILFERRIFAANGQRQLVYFGALIGGKPLPYRIDQYFAAGAKQGDNTKGDAEATWKRLSQPRLWSWAWDSFLNRTPLNGPQQFFRVSTPIRGSEVDGADRQLVEFLPRWLARTDYASEFSAWTALPREKQKKQEGGEASEGRVSKDQG